MEADQVALHMHLLDGIACKRFERRHDGADGVSRKHGRITHIFITSVGWRNKIAFRDQWHHTSLWNKTRYCRFHIYSWVTGYSEPEYKQTDTQKFAGKWTDMDKTNYASKKKPRYEEATNVSRFNIFPLISSLSALFSFWPFPCLFFFPQLPHPSVFFLAPTDTNSNQQRTQLDSLPQLYSLTV